MKRLLLAAMLSASTPTSCAPATGPTDNQQYASTEVKLPDGTYVFCVYDAHSAEGHQSPDCDWTHIHAQPVMVHVEKKEGEK